MSGDRQAAPFISIFRQQELDYSAGAPNNALLVLRLSDGRFAGVLRSMGEAEGKLEGCISLCAISAGSATRVDMISSLEWAAFEKRNFGRDSIGRDWKHWYYIPFEVDSENRSALSYDIFMAFCKGVAPRVLDTERDRVECRCKELDLPECICEERDPSECCCKARNHFYYERPLKDRDSDYCWATCVICSPSDRAEMLKQREKRRYGSSVPTLEICEFYNVLWVEYQDGIAYRRACGWVPKHIWDEIALEEKDIILG